MADFELHTFDFTSIEEMDPSIADGYRVIYDREVPFELRMDVQNGPQQVGTLEAIKAKVLVLVSRVNPIDALPCVILPVCETWMNRPTDTPHNAH